MKFCPYIFLLLFTIVTFQAYSGGGSDKGTATSTDGLDITARGAIGRLETTATGPLWTGDGGKNIRLAIVAPEIQGDVPSYLPIYIQGLLNSNFGKFSAINLIDRQNLDRIISEQNITSSGRFSDKDFVNIGNLANAQFFLFGTIQKLPGNRFSLQLSVTESTTGVRKATFMKEGTQAQLEGRAALINEATAEVLAQLGVQLTDAGRRDLLAGNTSTVQAQTGLAKGITAQAGGSEVEALFNFAQAITFDPSQLEALSLLSTLTTTISGGTISQRITNDIQARDRWIEAFKETVRFFEKHPPFEIIFDPNLFQVGETDYAKRTATLGMRIALDSSKAGFDALNALLGGLEKTGRRDAWGFSGWPFMDISPKTPGTVVFGGKRSLSYKVDVALVNENGKKIGSSSVTLKTEEIKFSSKDKDVSIPFSIDDVVKFKNIKAEDLTPTLTITIIAVNGISSSNLASTGYMRVETGDFEVREKELLERIRLAREQKEKKERENKIKAQDFFEQGMKNDEAGNYNQAINDFTKAISLDPNNAAAYNLRGIAYSEIGNYNQSINDFSQAIRINPNYAAAYYNRGNSNGKLKNYNQAINDFSQAIHLNPKDAKSYYFRGISYHYLGVRNGNEALEKEYYDKAISDYTQAIRLEPNYLDAYVSRAYANYNIYTLFGLKFEREPYFQQAWADREKALKISPNIEFEDMGR